MDYFLLKPDGEQTGTFSLDQVRTMLTKGVVDAETRFWHDGITEWLPVTRIEEFAHFQSILSAPKTPPPPPSYQAPLTMSGSLARAIPSPHQKQAIAPPTTVPARVDKPSPKPEEMERSAPVVPTTTTVRLVPEAPAPETVDVPATTVDEPAAVSEVAPVIEREWLPPAPKGWGRILLAGAMTLLALAALFLIWVLRANEDPFAHVTFTGSNVYVLMDQATIQPFESDSSASAMAKSLELQMAQTKDPLDLAKMKIALDEENSRHPDDVSRQYLQDGKAESIDPGTYKALGYFDDDGTLLVPRAGEAWVAVEYKGSVVFAHKLQ